VTLAGSFAAVRANGKDPMPPTGGQPAAGVRPGQGAGVSSTRGNISGTQRAIRTTPGQQAIPQGSVGPSQGSGIPAPGNSPGTESSIFDRWGNLRSSVNTPKISVEPGEGKQTLNGNSGSLPFDPKRTVKLSPQLAAPGQRRSSSFFDIFAETSLDGKTRTLAVPKNGRLSLDLPKGQASPAGEKLQTLLQAKNRGDLSVELKKLTESSDRQSQAALRNLNLDKWSGFYQKRLAKLDTFQDWDKSNLGQKLGLKQQLELQQTGGDLARRLDLNTKLQDAGGWEKHRQYGLIAPAFTTTAFSGWYAGGGCFPTHSWLPKWSPWVNWCWWDSCPLFYDPRPWVCIPIVYGPCHPWIYYAYPVWQPLSKVPCGTWIDVSRCVMTAGVDLQLLAVRFVDGGHPEQKLGPRYRVWFKNNSPVPIMEPFSVLLLASNAQTPTAEQMPQMGVVVPWMEIGEIKALDIRLPLSANQLGVTPEGYRVPFTYLHVLVDAHQQISETNEENNGAVLDRKDILPVDPAAFATDVTAAAPQSVLTIAGEGFGPEPGQVIVSVYGQQVQAEIHGWYDIGIQFAVPNFNLTKPVDAQVLVGRGDGAFANPITVQLVPQALLGIAAALPESPIPSQSQ
jgi:hypothetical protein